MLEELVFVKVEDHSRLVKDLEDLLDMLFMFCVGLAENEDVIEINCNEYINEWSQDLVHPMLESSWSVCETRRHDIPLVVAIAYQKRRLSLSSGICHWQ